MRTSGRPSHWLQIALVGTKQVIEYFFPHASPRMLCIQNLKISLPRSFANGIAAIVLAKIDQNAPVAHQRHGLDGHRIVRMAEEVAFEL